MANLIITHQCSRSCAYCFAAETRRNNLSGVQEMPYSKINEIIAFLKKSGQDELRLLGGEPSKHPELFSFINSGIENGMKILVFSNGLMEEETVSEIEKLSEKHIKLIVNAIDPDENKNEYLQQQKTLSRLKKKASIGINLYRPGQSLDYLITSIQKNELIPEIRIGLAHPTVPPRNTYLHTKFYGNVGERLTWFMDQARKENINISLDCGFVPCMFPEDMHEMLFKEFANLGKQCNPVLDVLPDFNVISCFPLDIAGKVTLSDFRDAQAIMGHFLGILEPFKSTGIYPHCTKCKYFLDERCYGGCRAHVINRFQHSGSFPEKEPIQNPKKKLAGPEDGPTENVPKRKEKWSVPYIDQPPAFWDRVYKEFGERIQGVYFPMPGDIIASGRPVQASQHLNTFLSENTYQKILTINPVVLPNQVEKTGPLIIKEIEKLIKKINIQEITLSNVLLGEVIKKEFPDISLTASTLLDIRDPVQLVMIDNIFDKVVPSGKILRDLKALKKLRNAYHGKIRLLVNEACIPGCVHRMQHFYEMGLRDIKHPESLCNEMLLKNPWLRLTGAWILPQFLNLYDGLFDECKLAGRISLQDPERYLHVLSHYLEEKDLSPHEIGGGPASPYAPMDISRAFFEHTLHCNHLCNECNYCKDYWNARMTKNEGRKQNPFNPRKKGTTNTIHELILQNSGFIPSDIDTDLIIHQHQKLPAAYDISEKQMPLPEWKEKGLPQRGKESWKLIREKIEPPSTVPLSIYVHIPFCDRRCYFCDCHSSFVPKKKPEKLERFSRLLLSEIDLWSRSSQLGQRPVTTLHFGGGTPNYLPLSYLQEITNRLKERFHITGNTELALESTSSLLHEKHLEKLRDLGFSRLHVGIQSLNDEIRKVLGRKESSKEVTGKLVAAMSMGFTVSVDIIYGLPYQDILSIISTISRLVQIGIHGFSLYHLNISDRNKKFFSNLKVFDRDIWRDYLLFQIADQFLIRQGFRKNHFVHYAKEEDRNLYYNHVRRGEDLLALGPTADGFFDDYYYLHEWIKEYLAYQELSHPPISGGGFISQGEIQQRPLKARLLCANVDEKTIKKHAAESLFDKWNAHGLTRKVNSHYTLTGTGSWFINQMVHELMNNGI